MAKSTNLVYFTQPYDGSSDSVYRLVVDAASVANVIVMRSDSEAMAGLDIIRSIESVIQKASLVVADVSHGNPSVMYEVGFAQAHSKPILLLASSSRSVPFDLTRARIFIYDTEKPGEFVRDLSRLVADAVKNPDAFLLGHVAAEREKNPSVFISYSHSEKDFLDRLLVHLRPLERDGLIDLWVDTRLRPGDRWRKEIEKALERATVAILLISADFLASDFITENELPPLLKNAEGRGTRIVPLIVKPCRFARDANLRHFQAVNDPKHSLVMLSGGEQESLYDQVAAEVERALRRS